MPVLRFLPGPTVGAATLKPRTTRAFTPWSAARNWQYHGTQGPTASQSRPADTFTTAADPVRSAALDVCVASSIAAAARGDAAQAAFDRE